MAVLPQPTILYAVYKENTISPVRIADNYIAKGLRERLEFLDFIFSAQVIGWVINENDRRDRGVPILLDKNGIMTGPGEGMVLLEYVTDEKLQEVVERAEKEARIDLCGVVESRLIDKAGANVELGRRAIARFRELMR